ncbi:DinB family protein [Paenibacillus sacheonensis]|uniref:DinB-like domain-containing protein n=1 Tax=Paenibacillus sacheonensis TaxID=742054 RepID=A0A7X5BXZ8_9BACL|nr:DinB family protein [Paenibacillus sacheonensis]MBM7564595.1 putative damage-inducible protein DinB [Paenibacillus sacheonensis]NBC69152.1 hypothetical protein [Paenibacillus sacheonensis]
MDNFPQLMQSFQALIPFVQSLRSMSDEQWHSPLQPGKWSTCAVIGHIMLWDRHFIAEAVQPLASGTPLTLRHSDYDLFNQEAAANAVTIHRDQLIADCVAHRHRLIDLITSMSAEQRDGLYMDGDGNPFAIQNYLEDFIGHDRHHRTQIEYFLSV